MYKLRPYQIEMSAAIVESFGNYRKPFIVQAATGAGKSLVIADAASKLGGSILVLCPSRELLLQNHEKMLSYNIPNTALYSASVNTKEIGNVTLATIGSIHRHPEKFKHFRHIIIDEAHNVNPSKLETMYKRFFEELGNPKICGLTATPYRIQQKYVTHNHQLYYTATLKVINRIWDKQKRSTFWGNIAYTCETDELIAAGYLAPIKYITDRVALDQLVVNSTGADYTAKSLDSWAMTKTDRITGIVEWLDKEPDMKRNLVFCTTIAQANAVSERLEALGIVFALVTGDTPKKEREALVEAYRRGEIKHMLNVGVFTTGFDIPELNCVVLARPTMSLALYYQMVGRGVRLDPADPLKTLRVVDLAGVVERLGRVETIKMGKEDGYKDTVISEVGRCDEQALFTFKVTKEVFNAKV